MHWEPWHLDLRIPAKENCYCAIAPDGKRFLLSSEGSVSIHDAVYGARTLTIPAKCRTAFFSPNGRWVVTLGSDTDDNAVWDSHTGVRKLVLRTLGKGYLTSWVVDFSPDCTAICAPLNGLNQSVEFSEASEFKIYDIQTGVSMPITGSKGSLVRFLPGAKQILFASGANACVRDLATGVVLSTMQHEHRVMAAAFIPGNRLVTGDDQRLYLWNLADKSLLKRSEGCRAFDLLVSTDGSSIQALEYDGSIYRECFNAPDLSFSAGYVLPGCDYLCGHSFNAEHNRFISGNSEDGVTIFTMCHPEYWWGVAWLPEFWLTAFFAGAFAWSIWKDRRDARFKTAKLLA